MSYTLHNDIVYKHVVGFHPHERPDLFAQACPERLVTPDYPPTYLMHGTADTDVAFECSERMYEALRSNGVEGAFARIEGGPHGCLGETENWPGPAEPQVEAAIEELRGFLMKPSESSNLSCAVLQQGRAYPRCDRSGPDTANGSFDAPKRAAATRAVRRSGLEIPTSGRHIPNTTSV